ncbi:ABC transporter permease [Streptomyces sp. A1-5]|uniref:ABC transporter permease n=1 Tax=Streptomyces sp. A1-5 TaxID=2738410 RepID=UPI001F1EB566|nr:ABC transporter permease [Streptomyces sp. A1-5]UJB44380.1 FtsX-like permease family protein [Streptomyces sp. A1-5]
MSVATGPRTGPAEVRPVRADSPARTLRTARFLASRSLRRHRKAWAAVFAALVLTSLLLGSFALATLSAFVGHARVERYAATSAVVTGDQTTRYTAKPWGDPPMTETQSLTERVRVPRAVRARLAAVPGVEAAVADDAVPVALAARDGGAVAGPRSDSGNSPIFGHPWSAAALAPFTLRAGHAPTGPRQVVLDGDLAARAGVRTGEHLTLQTLTAPTPYEVVGIAAPAAQGDATGLGHQGAVFFDDETARRLAGHPATTDAIGVLADPGVDVRQLYPRLRQALDGAHPARDASAGTRYKEDATALRVLTGNGRGEPEFLESAPSRMSLLMLLATVCVTVLMIAVLVVSSTVAQAVHQRSREMALLRAVGATPRQLRVTVAREINVVAVAAALLGAIGAVPVFLQLIAMLQERGAVPMGLELPTPVWMFAVPVLTAGLTLLVARLSAALACGRMAKLRPAQAMGEAQREPAQPGRGRTITGLVVLFLGMSSAGTAALQYGELAAAAASTAALALVIACALLGPWIARGAMRLLAVPARRLGGAGGYLAAASSHANSRRLGAAITPIVLVVAFVGVQLSAGATLDRQGGAQAAQALRAQLAVTTDGPGIPDEAVRRSGEVPGVAAATGVLHSTVVLARRETGEPKLDRLPVMGVDPAALSATLDPAVLSGTLAHLGRGTVAVGKDRARSLDLKPGSTVTLRYGDGAAVPLKVAAVYQNSLALGDFLFAAQELAPHLAAPLNSRILLGLKPGADPAAVRKELAGALTTAALHTTVTERPTTEHLQAEDRGIGQVITVVAVGVIGGFTAIAVLSTLTLIMVGRRGEMVLLRLVGASRGQLRRMLGVEAAIVVTVGVVVGALAAAIPLTAFSLALTGSAPYIPPAQAGLIVLTVVVTSAAGYLLPARSALRTRHPADLARR